jgi:hypothetical protein
MSQSNTVNEGIPPSRVITTKPKNPPPQPVYTCECVCIDWFTPLKNGGKTIYNYTDGTQQHQCIDIGKGVPCGDKVNLKIITNEEARENCPYDDWDDPDTKMPKDLVTYLREWGKNDSYDSRFDINHPDHYLNHYCNLRELITHLQKKNGYEFEPIYGTTDEIKAKIEIAELEELKQASIDSQ